MRAGPPVSAAGRLRRRCRVKFPVVTEVLDVRGAMEDRLKIVAEFCLAVRGQAQVVAAEIAREHGQAGMVGRCGALSAPK